MTLQDEAAVAPRTTYREVLAQREFTAVLTAWLISMLGNVLADVALSYIVFQRTGSPFQAAIAFSIGWLPHLFIGTLLSALPDRYPPRRLMISCDLVSAAIVSLMVIRGMPVGGAAGPRRPAGLLHADLRRRPGRDPAGPARTATATSSVRRC